MTDIQKNSFLFLKDHPWDYFTPIANALDTSKSGNICDDETFLRTFMSQSNIEYINNMIKKTVYNNSCDNYIIRDQKQEHLEQIMKGIYNYNAQHLPFNQKEQFNILNNLVIEHCVKNILAEINVRFKFIEYQSTPLKPLPQPINTSTSGKKSYLPLLSYNSTINYNNADDDDDDNSSTAEPILPGRKSKKIEIPTIFDKKVIQLSVKEMENDNKSYYFTDRNTNMYAKEKKVTKNVEPTKFYNNPNFEDNSFKRHDNANYKSVPAPTQKNYFVPVQESSRMSKK